MESEIARLIEHANTLQEVVGGMLLLRRSDVTTVRRFLNTLQDDDFRFLMKLDFRAKLIYLELRYVL